MEMKDKAEKERRRQDEPKRNKRWDSPRELKLAQKTSPFSRSFNTNNDKYQGDSEYDEGNQRQFYNRVPPSRDSYHQPGTLLEK